ncbi:hypothetical protein K438DRAFT_1773920 [Mycena galopus ATCC 62051]|nr:hypothetical protein K438DRAFT_1773920 [Mycena galopus ATCC 62051]
MPRQLTGAKAHLDHIATCLTLVLPLLDELNDAFGPPFVQSILNTVQSLINLVQNVKQNRNECAQLMENIHQILYAVVELHIKSEIVGSLPPSMLDNIGKFIETLHKIYTFVEAQQQGKKIKHLFGNNEMNKLLQDCHARLKQAQEMFGIQTQTQTLDELTEFRKTANLMHKEMMQLIENLSETTVSERSSLGQVYLGVNESKNSAEAATTSVELAALIGLHVGFKSGQDLTKPVVQYFSRKMSRLLILDNLETVWEPIHSRAGVEEFLSLLTNLEHLALIITMRGAERPAKVGWTHPFLLPLQPLSNDTAKQTFIEITDNFNTLEEIEQLLGFTDNMPLAVDLIAHLADYEGFSSVLSRWKTEKTSLLSVGFDRQSSVDTSISLSLSSPRITSDSKELLSLLSILPNGLSEAELVQGKLGIPDILTCKAVLLATSLAYRDNNQRLVLLMPIREYIQRVLPPSQAHIQPIHKYFHALLLLYTEYQGEQLQPLVHQITLNLANLQDILRLGLHANAPTLAETIQFVSEAMIAQAIGYVEDTKDPALADSMKLHGGYFFQHKGDVQQASQFLHKALGKSDFCEDNRQCRVMFRLAHFKWCTGNYSAAMAYASESQKLSKVAGDLYYEGNANYLVALLHRRLGDYQKSVAQLQRVGELLHICGLSGGALLNIGLIDIMINEAKEDTYCKLQVAQEILRRDGIRGIIACGMVQAVIELKDEKFDSAMAKFQESLCLSWGKHAESDIFCLEQLANIKAWPANMWGYKWPIIYLAYANRSKAKLDCHKALLFLGDALIANDDENSAASLYQVALAGFNQMDVHHSRAQCMLHLGDQASKHGCTSEAITFWEAARPLFEWASQTKDVAQIDSRLATWEKVHHKALVKLETLHAPLQLGKEETLDITGEDADDEDAEEHIVPLTV